MRNPKEWTKNCPKCHVFLGKSHICKEKIPFEVRLFSKINKTKNCWIWKGGVCADGYPRMAPHEGRPPIKTSRAVWKYYRGEIPKGLFVCHSCDNPRCVSLKHLWLGTPKDNVQDAIKKGRMTFDHLVGARWK